jgi:hypothetical protein
MLLKSRPTQGCSSKQEQVKGIYVTKDKRLEQKQEIAKAHFQIGSSDTSNYSSFCMNNN